MLLCKGKTKDTFYFPGGHVEFSEDSVAALKRELKEEIDADVTSARFIGVWENQFVQEGTQKHEIIILFEVSLASPDIHNMEEHIESRWVSLAEFKSARILPISLKERVFQWMQDAQVFFGSEKDGIKN